MQNYQVKIKGTVPLLIDRFIPQATGVKARGKIVEIPIEESLYKNDEGLFIPNRMVMWCIKEAAGWVYERPRTTYKASILGLIEIRPLQIPLNAKWEVYTRSIKRKNGERIIKSSPMFNDWGLEFEIGKDDPLPFENLKEILNIAGNRFGLGIFRIGGYGRFKIENFKEI